MYRKPLNRKRFNLNLNDDELSLKKSQKKKRKREKDTAKLLETNTVPDKTVNSEMKINDDEDVAEETFNDDILQDDPFMMQYNYELSPKILAAIADKPINLEKIQTNWTKLGYVQFVKPKPAEDDDDVNNVKLLDTQMYAQLRSLPKCPTEFKWEKLHLKKQILDNVKKEFMNISCNSGLVEELLTIACNYHDIYYPEENFENIEDIQFMYCTHVINHVIKSRLKVMHHDAKLLKKPNVPEEFRDQGLVRPKVLILLPFRETAHRVVKMLSSILLGDKENVMNKKRFNEEYTGNEIVMPEKNPKPPDYQLLFSGNTDDNFRLGITVTKKCLKLFTDFYSSDIIIASPLGLRMLIGSEGEKNRDYDFLSSIELLIMDQSQVFIMQNWEHLLQVTNHLHLQPKDQHDTDLARVRMWVLNGCAKYYMQSLIFSSHPIPEITALYNSTLINYGGKATIINPVKTGTICQVAVHVPQVFHEISTNSVLTAVDDRFETFVSDILPQFKDTSIKHTLIFIPSYFDFVRLRNYFKKQEMQFVHICEYTQEQKISRARSKIFHGKTQFLLYTERFHFYRRIKLRGIRRIIFYQPPTNPIFYSEICNFLHDFKKGKEDIDDTNDIDLSVNVLFTKYDVVQLALIVGTEKATRMLASEKTVHMFMSS